MEGNNTNVMSNDDIIKDFEELFGSDDPDTDDVDVTTDDDDVDDDTDTDVDDDDATDNQDDDSDDDSDSDDSDDDDDDSTDDDNSDKNKKSKTNAKSDTQSKQNHAFAELRKQNADMTRLLKDFGKLIGFDDKASVDDISAKLKDVLLDKQAKDSGISKEILERLDKAEAVIAENNKIKLEKEVTSTFSDLIEEHHLSKEDVDEFTRYLIENGKNPMEDPTVDIKAEYLKLHWQDMLAAAADNAVDKEKARKQKVEKHAASKVDPSHDKGEGGKIETVKDLDALFDSIDL